MPYLPLYVQDFLTDEKLIECSAESTGVYIRLLCIMHKSHEYGKILLKQKDKQNPKQNESKISDFAYKLAKQMPWDMDVILRGLTELAAEGVITIEGDVLFQKRMVKDGQISEKRANAGQKGGQKSKIKNPAHGFSPGFASSFASGFAQAKPQANSENENDNDNEYDPYREKEESIEEEDTGDRAREAPPDPLHDQELARVIAYYQDAVDPLPSATCVQELIAFKNQFGAEIVIHAIDRGKDQLKQKVNWSYIRGILRQYARENVQTLGDVLRSEEEFDESVNRGARSSGHGAAARPSASAGAMSDLQEIHKLFEDGGGGSS